jgi:DNA-binding MarR family transcriptional regulator
MRKASKQTTPYESEEQHLSRLMLLAYRACVNRSLTSLRSSNSPAITMAHTALLANIGREGAWVSVLADRAGISKQSMRELAIDLEKKGIVRRGADPLDERATRILLTARGQKLLKRVQSIKDELDTECEAIVGKTQMANLRRALQKLIAELPL